MPVSPSEEPADKEGLNQNGDTAGSGNEEGMEGVGGEDDDE